MKLASSAALLAIVAALAGCASRPPPAPVVERAPGPLAAPAPAVRKAEPPPVRTYTVKRGETLFGIALDHGLDYRELAEWNGITNASVIRAGDVLRLGPPAQQVTPPSEIAVQVSPVTSAGPVESRSLGPGGLPTPERRPETAPPPAQMPDQTTIARIEPRPQDARPEAQSPAARPVLPPPAKPEAPPPVAKVEPSPQAARPEAGPAPDDEDKVDWIWPARGRIVERFSDSGGKGVDIAGRVGDPVYASAPGKVVYSGSGLRGYGKLIIIKHNKTYLSAYAHNNQILVKEGQNVEKGQKIGEVGATDADSPRLHFEIRRLGKPVDPLKYLPEVPQ